MTFRPDFYTIPNMEIGDALASAMKAGSIRDEELAVRLGVSAGSVQLWRLKKGKPSAVNLMKLRKELVGFAELLDSGAAA